MLTIPDVFLNGESSWAARLKHMETMDFNEDFLRGIPVGNWQAVVRRVRESEKERIVPVDVCCNAGCGGPPSYACSRCMQAAYCSPSCQTQHWKLGGHKQRCWPLRSGDRIEVVGGNSVKFPDIGSRGILIEYFDDEEEKWGLCLDNGKRLLIKRNNLLRVEHDS